MILSWRQVTKLNSTYIEPLLRNMDASGRVHTTFEQTGTATGRISSNDPNLQNIPVRTDIGREIRRAFRAKEGCVLVDGDYSQIELRILAHMSGDKNMRDTFIRGEDIHTRTAALVNGVGMEEVTDHMRSAAKAVNFGIVYGISDFGLAQNIGISRKEAAEFIAKYFTTYPGVHEFMERAKQEGRKKGYSQTLYGRRRPLPELQSSNFNTRSFGERVAINTPIQGTAADIIKAAMVRVHEELLKGKYRARLILQVHDELIIETPQNEMEKVQKLLKNTMENIISLDVPLLSDVNTGVNWYESK
jgi:DNA polymerase-1